MRYKLRIDNRAQAIEQMRQRLLRSSMPRLLMSLMLLFTAAAGFLLSFSLLQLGVTQMAVRYPLAVLLAYCVFLLLLRLWLAYQRTRERKLNVDVDLSSIDWLASPSWSRSSKETGAEFKFSGGGDSGGGGAGGSWGGDSISQSPRSTTRVADQNLSSSGSGLDLDWDDGLVIILPVVAVVGALIGAFYIIYVAPALMAEILVDALLVTGLYKRLKGVEERHWLRAAVRRTLWPVVIVTILFVIAGYLVQQIVPEAQSIGGVWAHIRDS